MMFLVFFLHISVISKLYLHCLSLCHLSLCLSVLVPLASQILDQQISLLPPAILSCLLGAATLAVAHAHVVQLHHDK